MEPNKLEQDFRNKLNAREIQPSEAAWDRLDAMLSVAEQKKPKRTFKWLYLAAGLAVFFSVGLFLFRQEKATPEVQLGTDTVVVSEKNQETPKHQNEQEIVTATQQYGDVTFTNASRSQAVAVNGKTNDKSVRTIKQDVVPIEINKEIRKESIEEAPILEQAPKKEMLAYDDPKLGNKLPENKRQVKVNANSLLSSVEGELTTEFRKTTLEKLRGNLETVREVVANRNYEY